MLRYKNMGGGLMQLVAYGAQDIYLTGNPQITFFKVVYRRHTNFSIETIQQTINGTNTLTSSATSGTVTISRNGDLVHDIWVLSETANIGAGDQIVNQVDLEIGGQLIDRQTKEWMQIWAELTLNHDKAVAYRCMTGTGRISESAASATSAGTKGALNATGAHGNVNIVQVPLQFWFCRNPGLALPLIALQYHEVKLKFTWGTTTQTGGTPVVQVWADYIYLDTDERRRFAQVSHEYLIEQVQYQAANTSGSFKLNFNHPVKELIWTSLENLSPTGSDTVLKATTGKTTLKLNGHDRFSGQYEEYFQLRQPYKYHTNIPGTNLPVAAGAPGGGGIHHGWDDNYGKWIASHDAGTGSSTAATALHCTVSASETVDGRAGSSATLQVGTNFIPSASSPNYPHIGDVLEVTFADVSEGNSWRTHDWIVRSVTFDTASWVIGLWHPIDFGTHWAVTTSSHDNVSIKYVHRVTHGKSHCSNLDKKVNVYSFALKPEEHQPSGTCNFSRIDNAKLNITTSTGMTGACNIYAINYNVLRIMSGMGGLAYSN
jgi:hypothetical protein